jgi:hypothetical protein
VYKGDDILEDELWWLDEQNDSKGLIGDMLGNAKDWFSDFITEWAFNILTLFADIFSAVMLLMLMILLSRLIYTSDRNNRKELYDGVTTYALGLFVLRLLSTVFPIIAKGGM